VNSVRRELIPKYFAELREYLPISGKDFERLLSAIESALAPEPMNYGHKAERLVHDDLLAGGRSVKLAVTSLLRRRYGFAMMPEYFELKIHSEGRHYAAETNLAAICNLPDSEVSGIIEIAIPALAAMNLRIEEMEMHSSLSEFDTDDVDFFEFSLRYLLDRDNADHAGNAFKRVIKVLGLPEIPSKRFDVERFPQLRASPECMEFREWLARISEWSDAEIIDRVTEFRERLARLYGTGIGKSLRIMVSCGLGFVVPPVGWALGTAQGLLENFVLEKLLRPSGAIAFIKTGYPSVFGNS